MRGANTQVTERRHSQNRRAPTPCTQGRSQSSRSSIHNIGTESNTGEKQFNNITFNSVNIVIAGIDKTSKILDNVEAYTTVKFRKSKANTAHLKAKINTGVMGNTLPLRTFSLARYGPRK